MEFVFKINGVDMPTPAHKGFVLTSADADGPSTTRNARGYLTRDRVRSGIRKIEVTYPFPTAEQCKLVLDAISPEFFRVTYLDPQYGVVTKEMYTGDRSFPMYGTTAKGELRWESLSFSLIER